MKGKILEEVYDRNASYSDRIRIPFLFQGQYYDHETELAYNRLRYYDPELGWYISEDVIGLNSSNIALHAYSEDPNYILDIWGLDVRDGSGRLHIKYHEFKNGEIYDGYASTLLSDKFSPFEVPSRRYGGVFGLFDDGDPPIVDFVGKGKRGKETARELELLDFEESGGLANADNRQSPVGLNNKRRNRYIKAAREYKRKMISARKRKRKSYHK